MPMHEVPKYEDAAFWRDEPALTDPQIFQYLPSVDGEPSDVMIIEDPPHNDGNGGDVDGNAGHGNHDMDDNAGHGNHDMDMDDEDVSDGEADKMEAMLKDLTGATCHEGT